LVAQQQIQQQRRPDLPPHGILAVAQKIPQLQGLFDLPKELLNLPAATIQVGNRLRAPSQIVRQERHFLLPAIADH